MIMLVRLGDIALLDLAELASSRQSLRERLLRGYTMGEDHTIEEYLDDLRGRIQVKLARGGAPADPGTLRLVCLAIALRVADPAGLRLLMKPLSPQLYPALETMLAQVDRDFGDEIAELQDLIADAQEDPAWLAEVQQAMQRRAVSVEKRLQEHIAHLILELFVELSGE